MTSYKILKINEKNGLNWIELEVTFADGEKYNKKMMCDTSSVESIKAAVNEWLSNYEPQRVVVDKEAQKELKALIGKKQEAEAVDPA